MIERIINRLIQTFECIKNKKLLRKLKAENYTDLISTSSLSRLPVDVARYGTESLVKNSYFHPSTVYYIQVKNEDLELIAFYKLRRVLTNMSAIGTSGMDIYKFRDNRYSWIDCYAPVKKNEMRLKIKLDGLKKNDIVAILMPGYAQVEHILMASESGTLVNDDINYTGKISLYGSSITQGCAASRPGLSYSNILITQYGYKVNNFGFSESAKGEEAVIEYIANIKSDVFVLEYDHNATVEELKNTHLVAYKTIRKNNPEALIIILSRLSGGISITESEEERRFDIINHTYEEAIRNGDNRVSFIRGRDLVEGSPRDILADGKHPNDTGMEIIARAIASEIKRLGDQQC